jgi:serine/threonine protein kinase
MKMIHNHKIAYGILLERCEEDLIQFMQRKKHLDSKILASCIGQLLIGVEFLHTNGIRHNDIKLENVLIKDSSKTKPLLKICDFGLAHSNSWEYKGRLFGSLQPINPHDDKKMPYQYFGSDAYLPSREDATGRLVFLRDEWALGCVIFAITYGRMLYLKYEEAKDVIFQVGREKKYKFFADLLGVAPRGSESIIQCLIREEPLTISVVCQRFVVQQ